MLRSLQRSSWIRSHWVRAHIRPLRCSFCGKNEHEVCRLVSGPSVYICDECVAKCVQVLGAHGGLPPDGTTH